MSNSNQDRHSEVRFGFVVNSGRMSSLGSSGATFVGHKSSRDVSAYRSTSGIGQSHLRSAR